MARKKRRADGRLEEKVTIGLNPRTGQRVRKSVYADTPAALDRAATRLRAARDRGLPVDVERQTVEQYLTAWLADVREVVRPRTYESYELTVRLHISPHIGRLPLQKLAPQHIRALLRERAEHGGRLDRKTKRPVGLSPRSVQYIRAVLRIALNQAVKYELVGRNVAALVDDPPGARRRLRASPLTLEQARALLTAARGDRLETLYSVALALGLRRGEALGLRWSDIDLEAGTLTVSEQLQRIDGHLVFCPPKTEESRRTLPLPQALIAALRLHKERQAEERRGVGSAWVEHRLLFPSPIGTPLDPASLLRQYKALLKRAKLPSIRFHDLRHACASLLLAQGVDLKVIQATLGHSTIGTTADVYTHVMPSLQRAVADHMETALWGS